MKIISLIAVILSAIGAINWGLVGAFNFNLVAALFGADSVLSKVVYVLVGISGILLLFTISHIINPTQTLHNNP